LNYFHRKNACQSGQHNKVYENMEEAYPVDGGSNYVGKLDVN